MTDPRNAATIPEHVRREAFEAAVIALRVALASILGSRPQRATHPLRAARADGRDGATPGRARPGRVVTSPAQDGSGNVVTDGGTGAALMSFIT